MGMFGLFAVLMFPAAFSMLKERKEKVTSGAVTYNYPLILIEGLVVGAITGIIGAGGGFLIIPALVLLANVEMKVAVGTSLIIIAFKSLLGFFLGDALTMEINWQFLTVFTSISLVGIFIGSVDVVVQYRPRAYVESQLHRKTGSSSAVPSATVAAEQVDADEGDVARDGLRVRHELANADEDILGAHQVAKCAPLQQHSRIASGALRAVFASRRKSPRIRKTLSHLKRASAEDSGQRQRRGVGRVRRLGC